MGGPRAKIRGTRTAGPVVCYLLYYSPMQYNLKLPPEARLELLKGSVARKTRIQMTHVSVWCGSVCMCEGTLNLDMHTVVVFCCVVASV